VAGQAARIEQLAASAFSRGVDVLVMPEYSLTEGVHGALMARESDEPRPTLVCMGVAGGTDDDGYVMNEGRLIVTTLGIDRDYSISIATPPKVHPARIGDAIERVRSGTEIRVFVSERFSLCVLICRDAMDDSIVTQLAAIGVNLLLVPAMSPKTASLVDSAAALCRRSQAFVVIANGPAIWAMTAGEGSPENDSAVRAEAVFAGPYAELPDRFWAGSVPSDAGPDARQPGLWTLSFAERRIQTAGEQ
jgi:predicted amidohydrolase